MRVPPHTIGGAYPDGGVDVRPEASDTASEPAPDDAAPTRISRPVKKPAVAQPSRKTPGRRRAKPCTSSSAPSPDVVRDRSGLVDPPFGERVGLVTDTANRLHDLIRLRAALFSELVLGLVHEPARLRRDLVLHVARLVLRRVGYLRRLRGRRLRHLPGLLAGSVGDLARLSAMTITHDLLLLRRLATSLPGVSCSETHPKVCFRVRNSPAAPLGSERQRLNRGTGSPPRICLDPVPYPGVARMETETARVAKQD